jgi:hypothetical protein
MKLPSDWLQGKFDGWVKRGAIVRFHAEDLQDPDHPDGKPKFAVILNASLPASEVLYVFSTSKTEFYGKHKQFEPAIIRIPPGRYDCFPLETIIPFRTIHSIDVEKLKAQYGAQRLTFCGELTAEHIAKADAIIKVGLFISPRQKTLILPT